MLLNSVMMTSSNGNIFRDTRPLCGEFTDPGEFPAQSPVTRSFDVFFDLCLNDGWVNNREAGDLRRHCVHYDVIVMVVPGNVQKLQWIGHQNFRQWQWLTVTNLASTIFADDISPDGTTPSSHSGDCKMTPVLQEVWLAELRCFLLNNLFKYIKGVNGLWFETLWIYVLSL